MARFHCLIGGTRASRDAAARDRTRASGRRVVDAPPASRWPFERHILPDALHDDSIAVSIPDLHLAFPAGQASGTRLVLTQSTYQLQRWIDWLDAHPGACVVAHANRAALARAAQEAFAGRGPWTHIDLVPLEGDEDHGGDGVEPAVDVLHRALDAGSPEQRLDVFARAAARTPENPALHLALGSAHMEAQQLADAEAAIERAIALAPDWEAPWFESGKVWLRADDLERAAARFAEAARLMPGFAAALSNLGAALAELDQVDAAIAALRQALRYDPAGFPIFNNLAVICREQGRLDDAVDAGRQVIRLAPAFVFGYYNLGHALFLQGRFEEARDMYAEGHRRDSQKNAVQACRLAVARAAAGDSATAVHEITALADRLADDARSEILGEAEATLDALLAGPLAGSEDVLRVLEMVRARRRG